MGLSSLCAEHFINGRQFPGSQSCSGGGCIHRITSIGLAAVQSCIAAQLWTDFLGLCLLQTG